MKIFEIKQEQKYDYDADGFIREPSQIKSWLYQCFDHKTVGQEFESCVIHPNGTVSGSGSVSFNLKKDTQLRVQFTKVQGSFSIFGDSGSVLEDLRGFPTEVTTFTALHGINTKSYKGLTKKTAALTIFNLLPVKSFEEFPQMLHCHVDIIESLEGIHKKIKSLNIFSLKVLKNPKGFLDIMKIPDIKKVSFTGEQRSTEQLHIAIKKIKPYVGKGKVGIIDAQDALMDAGLDKFAE